MNINIQNIAKAFELQPAKQKQVKAILVTDDHIEFDDEAEAYSYLYDLLLERDGKWPSYIVGLIHTDENGSLKFTCSDDLEDYTREELEKEKQADKQFGSYEQEHRTY